MKENLEPSSDILNEAYLDQCGVTNNTNEDDIVVDAIDTIISNTDRDFVVNPGQILGLDQAVLQSIDRCRMFINYNTNKLLNEIVLANEDLKRKMYGCILIVGGGMKFSGIGTWLQNRISLQIPYLYRAGI